MTRRVAELVAEALIAHRVDRVFSVPGESFLPLLDALHDRPEVDLVTCRHEGSAALAAVADAKLTGRAGVVAVSRGPGAFNAALALHVAEQEAIPLVLLVGQVDRPNLGRGAVQEMDGWQAFAGTIKHATCIDDPARAGEEIARAFASAVSGTPGPVVVELPEDVLSLAAPAGSPRTHGLARPEVSGNVAEAALEMIAAASRPILLVGGECRSDAFRADLQALAERLALPVAVTNKNQDQFPNDHVLFVGQLGFFAAPAHLELFAKADLLVAVGTRLGDLSTMGFAVPRQEPEPQTLIHVYPDPAAIGRRFATALPVVSTSDAFVRALLAAVPPQRAEPGWLAAVADARRATHGWVSGAVPEADVLGRTVDAIARRAEPDSVVTTDSGNFAGWVHRAFSFTAQNRLLGSACGAMGTGVPSGLAASLRHPGRRVIAFCGDGGFLMTGNELATACARGLDLVLVVSNNGSYGTIRSYQEKAYPDRVSGTDLANPRFAALAEAFGARGFTVGSAGEADAIVGEALSCRGPVLIEVMCDVRHTLDMTVRAFREAAPSQ